MTCSLLFIDFDSRLIPLLQVPTKLTLIDCCTSAILNSGFKAPEIINISYNYVWLEFKFENNVRIISYEIMKK